MNTKPIVCPTLYCNSLEDDDLKYRGRSVAEMENHPPIIHTEDLETFMLEPGEPHSIDNHSMNQSKGLSRPPLGGLSSAKGQGGPNATAAPKIKYTPVANYILQLKLMHE